MNRTFSAAEYERVCNAFWDALALTHDERASFLAGLSANLREDVRDMLAAHDTATRDGWLEVTHAEPEAIRKPADVPAEIAGYEILGVIGGGGMGTVYRARQQSPRRDVAIKVVRADRSAPTVVQRFLREAEILGRLQHPAIAQVYQSGVWLGAPGAQQPYLVMELIEGLPLDRYVTERKLAATDVIELLIRICDAVHHAHQKGVIHRDLKPANVLVTRDGQPKVLDFGVARLVDSKSVADTWETQPGEFVGTLPYMSPEQLDEGAADADVRADVYALGVTAFRALAGQLPYEFSNRSIVQIARTVAEEAPRRLRALRPELDRDLELIVHKAFARDPEQRYASAADFADDLRTFRAGGAVAARPPSLRYKLRVFARQHRAFAAALLLAFAALVLATGVSSTFAVQAARASAREREQAQQATAAQVLAEQEAAKAEATLEFLLDDLFGRGNRDVKLTAESTMLEAIDRAAAEVDELRDPTTRAEIQHVVSTLYANIGTAESERNLYEEALQFAEAAVDTLESAGLHNDEQRVKAELQAAMCLSYVNRFEESVERAQAALALAERTGAVPDEYACKIKLELASTYRQLGRSELAERLVRETLRELEGLPEGTPGTMARAYELLGRIAADHLAERREEAMAHFQRVIELCPADELPRMRAGALSRLAELYMNDDPARARALITESLALRREIFPTGHRTIAQSVSALGVLELTQDNPQAALPLLQEAAEVYEIGAGGKPDMSAALMKFYVGVCQHQLENHEAAAAQLAAAIADFESVLPPDHWYIPNTRSRYAVCLAALGRDAEADAQFALATEEFAAAGERAPVHLVQAHQDRLAARAAALPDANAATPQSPE